MKMSYLDYYKTILKKVSFNKQLFHKELNKALRYLGEDERESLLVWIKTSGFEAELHHPETLRLKSEAA